MGKLEICVDSPEDLALAIAAKVDRVELCSALDLGGLTPSAGLIAQARMSEIPIYAMIRPRGGDFVYSELELQSMESDIQATRQAGLAGVVFGALKADQTLDQSALRMLCNAAKGLGMTLHRAVDDMVSPRGAVLSAIELGFERILTSGGAAKAVDGLDELSAMVELADGRIEIMAGSGVSHLCVADLRAANIQSFHASCRVKDQDSGHGRINVEALGRLHDAAKRS